MNTGVSGGLTAKGNFPAAGTNSVTVTGTVSEINATLADANGLSYLVTTDHLTDTLTIATQDQGTSPQLTATNTATINITEVLDASNTLPTSFTATEGTSKVLSGISISDADAIGNVTVTLSVVSGKLTLNTGVSGGLTASEIKQRHQLGHRDRHGIGDQCHARRCQWPRLDLVWRRPDSPHRTRWPLPPRTRAPPGVDGGQDRDIDITEVLDPATRCRPRSRPPKGPARCQRHLDQRCRCDRECHGDAVGGVRQIDLEHRGERRPDGRRDDQQRHQLVNRDRTVSEIDATLADANGLSYLVTTDHLTDTLTIATQDQGTSPQLTATNTATINITEVLDASNTLPTSFTATEGTSKVLSGISISDADAIGNVTVTLSVVSGKLTLNTGVSGGLTAGEITNNGTNSVTVTGTVSEINATLADANGLSYLVTTDHLTDTLTIATQDQGTSPQLTATNTATINITEVLDPATRCRPRSRPPKAPARCSAASRSAMPMPSAMSR